MGDRNNLHVCRHCGIVHATSSATPPERCVVCSAFRFSEYVLNDLLADVASDSRVAGDERERRESALAAAGR